MNELLRVAVRLLRDLARPARTGDTGPTGDYGLRGGFRRSAGSGRAGGSGRPGGPGIPERGTPEGSASLPRGPYPGDFDGPLTPRYAPHDDAVADPGEVVWAWVPYEEDHSRGKDRPVLVVGRDGRWLLALPLTSKDHDRDAAQEAGAGRHWVDVGAGAWDSRHRPSEARVDRVLRIDPAAVRRIGARLDASRFDEVAAAMARFRR